MKKKEASNGSGIVMKWLMKNGENNGVVRPKEFADVNRNGWCK